MKDAVSSHLENGIIQRFAQLDNHAPEFDAQYAINCRIHALEAIDPQVLARISRNTLTLLSQDEPQDLKLEKLMIGQSPDAVFEQLLAVLEQPTLTDYLLKLKPDATNTEAIVGGFNQWRSYWLNHLEHPDSPIPSIITNEADAMQYLALTTIGRIGTEQELNDSYRTISAHYSTVAQLCGYPPLSSEQIWQVALSQLRPIIMPIDEVSQTCITDATEFAYRITGNNTSRKNRVTEALQKTLLAQDAWWNVVNEPIDPLTRDLLTVAMKNLSSREAIPLLLDTLHRKIHQDEIFVRAAHDPHTPLPLTGHLLENIQWFIDQSLLKDIGETQRYLANHLIDTKTFCDIFTQFFTDPRLRDTSVIKVSDDIFSYFGTTYRLTGQPHDATEIKELTFGTAALRDQNGKLIAIYNLLPGLLDDKKEIPYHLSESTPEALLFEREGLRKPLPEELLNQFIHELPAVQAHLQNLFNDQFNPQVFTLPMYYQLWSYLRAHPDSSALVDDYIKKHGPRSMLSFLTGEHGDTALTNILQLSTDENPDIFHFVHDVLLPSYNNLYDDADNYALQIGNTKESALAVRELLLLRGKALLSAAANLHQKNGRLTPEEMDFLNESGVHMRQLIRALADQTGEYARSINIEFDQVKDFFLLHDPEDPDTMTLYRTAFDLWFESAANKQITAPYYGRVDKITAEFYQAYDTISKDTSRTTVNRDIELPRFEASFLSDVKSGRLPTEATPDRPVKIGFIGMGTGSRVEADLIAFMKQHTRGYTFVGIDVIKPDALPQGVDEYHGLSVTQLVQEKDLHGTFDALYVIASPLMDVVELEKWRPVAEGISLLLKPGGKAEIDQANPHGKESYQMPIRDYHHRHPMEPEGLFERSFHLGTGTGHSTTKKWFFGPGPEFMIGLFGEYGLTCENLPHDKESLDALYLAIEQDPTILDGPGRLNLAKQAFYRVPPTGWIRSSYKYRKTGMTSPEAVLVGMARASTFR